MAVDASVTSALATYNTHYKTRTYTNTTRNNKTRTRNVHSTNTSTTNGLAWLQRLRIPHTRSIIRMLRRSIRLATITWSQRARWLTRVWLRIWIWTRLRSCVRTWTRMKNANDGHALCVYYYEHEYSYTQHTNTNGMIKGNTHTRATTSTTTRAHACMTTWSLVHGTPYTNNSNAYHATIHGTTTTSSTMCGNETTVMTTITTTNMKNHTTTETTA